MKKIISVFCVLFIFVGMMVFFTGCQDTENKPETNVDETNKEVGEKVEENGEEGEKEVEENKYKDIEKNPIVTMEMENGGIVKMELYPKVAPESVENFISLINQDFYNGLTFHRTIPEFMAQGGDPKGDGTGGPGYSIKGEFSNNNVENDISHVRGVLSMARAGNPYFPESAYNTAGSQFFIVTTDSTFLDGDYASFGRVLEGMDVVDEIVNSEVVTRDNSSSEANRPINPPVIKTMIVDTFGVTYDEPTKITK